MSWTLTKDTNIVTLPDPATDYESWDEKAQTLALTATGSPVVYDRQVTLHRCRVTWRDLTDADKQALAGFYHNAPTDDPPGVDGVSSTFTIADDATASATGRFADPTLRFTKDLRNRWSVTVELLVSDPIG